MDLFFICDSYEVKYKPTLLRAPVLREGPKTYKVQSGLGSWRSIVAKDRVDGEYSTYYTTPRAAWENYIERCKTRLSECERTREEVTKKLHIAQQVLGGL